MSVIWLYLTMLDLCEASIQCSIKLSLPSYTYKDIDDKIAIALQRNALNYEIEILNLQLHEFDGTRKYQRIIPTIQG